MQTKHAIVVNSQGYKVEFVLVEFPEIDGEVKEQPIGYVLKEGKSLVYEDISTALSMLNPRWNGSVWEETATPEEIEAARPEQPEPTPLPPTNAELAAQNLMIMEAITEVYEMLLGN